MYKVKILTIFFLSIIVGAIVFDSVRYTPFTLVIHAKTLEKGSSHIIITDIENRSKLVKFEVGNDRGDQSFYTIELPRMMTGSIVIPPLAPLGKYEINRISLGNERIRYNWDERIDCTQQLLDTRFIHREACNGNSPAIASNSDSAVVISQIPETGINTPASNRAITAILATLATLIGGLYLIGYKQEVKRETNISGYSSKAAWLVLTALYFYQFYHLWQYSVDLPFWEEWEFFGPQALPNGFTWEWLFGFVSHHRIVFTKLMAWINMKLFSLNFVTLKLLNYAIFGGLIIAMVKFKDIVLGRNVFPFFPLFLVFLMSPIAYEDHAASFQSQFHFVLIFAFLALYFAFKNTPSIKSTLAFTLFIILAVSSLSAGIVLGVTFLLLRTIYFSAGISAGRITRKAGLQAILISWALIIPAIMLWFYNFKKPEWNAPWLPPSDPKFWDVFFNMLSFGFGFEFESAFWGIVCLIITLTPLALIMTQKEKRWLASTWQVMAAILGILAIIALIGIGRGNLIGIAKTSRYAIFSFLLIPCSALAWWLALEGSIKRYVAIALLWLFCTVTYWNNWSYGIYRDLRQSDLLTLECVEQYAKGNGNGLCNETHVRPIGNYFDNAKKLDISFTRQFRAYENAK